MPPLNSYNKPEIEHNMVPASHFEKPDNREMSEILIRSRRCISKAVFHPGKTLRICAGRRKTAKMLKVRRPACYGIDHRLRAIIGVLEL